MYSSYSKRARLPIVLAAILLGMIPWCMAQSPEVMDTARRWTAAKFLGEVAPNRSESYLLTYLQSGKLDKNEIQGRRFRIVNQE